ncbi:hypothetical protein [Streptomyces diastaticus]|uniref:hypothetical protein n=1 Tax=Streptomyces diastaticus TaxID=1956 RepID=UPI003D169251
MPPALPPWPHYQLTSTPEGTVTITGPAAPAPQPTREAAVRAVGALAARTLRPPRPVRATAKDADGTRWALHIHPDGTAVPDPDHPDPQPPARKRGRRSEPPTGPTASTRPTPQSPPDSRPTPHQPQALLTQQSPPTTAPQPHPAAPSPVVSSSPAAAAEQPAALAAAVAAGHWETAAALISAEEARAIRTHGAYSAEAAHWIEVRADVADRSGEPARARDLRLQAARIRAAISSASAGR